jgi:hypothetical protein
MPTIPPAPPGGPESIRSGLVVAAKGWYEDPCRPRVSANVADHWTMLLDQWVASPEMPLFVRKARDNRGHMLRHNSGRSIVPTDNGPAHWSMTLALGGVMPTLSDVRAIIERDEIPVAMAFKRSEKDGAKFRCTRAMIDGPNACGWKVAHIEDVGLGYTGSLDQLPIADIAAHFVRFLSPANMFLVPKEYAGVAECPEFISVFQGGAANLLVRYEDKKVPYPCGVGDVPWSDGKRRSPAARPGEYPRGVE